MKLICIDESASWAREMSPNIGIDMFSIDAENRSVKQSTGMLREKAISEIEITEAEIRFTQTGYIDQKDIKESFRTTISRVTGVWIRSPHYADINGKRVFGGELEALAQAHGLTGFFGIQRKNSEGKCRLDDRVF